MSEAISVLDILIPTCLPPDAVSLRIQARELREHTKTPHRVIRSCQRGSASYNRNLCLRRCKTAGVAIMLDDDIHGFYPGWEQDLLGPLVDPLVMIASARLMTREGLVAQTCSRCYDLTPEEIEIRPGENCVLPTAAIAFRHMGVEFDEAFLGSGFEDGDWCFEYLRRFPGGKFIQSNKCRLVHLNEMKSQSEHWDHNQAYLHRKWLKPGVRNPENPYTDSCGSATAAI